MSDAALDVNTPAGLLRLGNAFCDAKALMTAVELGLFDLLKDQPATEAEIKSRLALHGRGLGDYLRLLVALGLLRTDGDRFSNAPGADSYLVTSAPTFIGGFLTRSSRNLYPAWGNLTEALRSGEKQSIGDFEFVLERPQLLRQFIGMMDALTQQLGPILAESYEFGSHRVLLDVGGCRGNLTSQLLKAHPDLTGKVFDLPQMRPFFEELVAENGLGERIEFFGGSFFDDPLPTADVVTIGHVLHDWDESQREFLVRKAFEAVEPGGALVVYDRMLEDGPSLVENLVISLDMLLVTDGGSEYPPEEIKRYGEQLGATSIEIRPLGDYDTIVVLRKQG